MKKLFIALFLFFLFLFVLFKSGTWESPKKEEVRRGFDYTVYEHEFHWNRFLRYIKNIPKRISNSRAWKTVYALIEKYK
ncbi:MAG: hypothetical protein KJ952_07340 [Candidatus Omnitrophica bacterium]|nr:hypothetical protein [Candidatus Omnitrophota bacterium]